MSAPPLRFALVRSATTASAELLRLVSAAAAGREVQLVSADNYAALGRLLALGHAELAWLPPRIGSRIQARGARPLVRFLRRGTSTYRAALVCHADRPVNVLELNDLRAAWVDRDSLAGYLLPLAWLKARGVEPSLAFAEERFVGSFAEALQSVLAGDAQLTSVYCAPAAADPQWSGLDLLPAQARQKLQILGYTDEVPNDALFASASLDDETVELLRRRLVELGQDPHWTAVLSAVFGADRFEPVPEGAYDQLEPLLHAASAPVALGHPCRKCGARVSPSARFCERCGEPMTADRAPASAPDRDAQPPSVPAQAAQPGWSEERRVASVLFADIVGFTAISSRLEPDDVRELANLCLVPLAGEVEAHGGTVIKYIGDCIMAAFGVPQSSERDAQAAVAAGLAISQRIAQVSGEVERRFGATVSVRVGINTGLVMVGSVGNTQANLDVMGAVVNVASRVQNAAEPGQVVIGPSTHPLVRAEFQCEPLGVAHLKGLAEGLSLHRVVGRFADAVPHVVAAPHAARITLRERESALLLSAFDQAVAQRSAQVIRVVAEPGMGANWLLGELRASLSQRDAPPLLLRGRAVASATLSPTPLAPVASMIREHFGIRAEEPVEQGRSRLRQALIAGARPAELDAEEAATLFSRLVFGASAEAPAPADTPSDAVHRPLSQWLNWLARSRPVCIIFEDLQWADDASLEVIDRTVGALGDAPVLVVLASRHELDERMPGWPGSADAQRIELSSVSAGELRRLLDGLLTEAPDVPNAMREELVGRAEGNPGHLKEFVRLLSDCGALVPGDEAGRWAWHPQRLGNLSLPDSIRGTVQARLDRLPLEQKDQLKQASVVGRTFWRGIVQALSPPTQDAQQLDQALDALERKRLVVGRPSTVAGERELMFRSQALRDICYESLPRQARQRAHQQVAEWLLGSAQQGTTWHAEVAGHLDAAGNHDAARPHFLSAAQHSAGIAANREAVVFYEKALAGWPSPQDLPGRAAALRGLAQVHSHIGDVEASLDALARAEEALVASGADGQTLARVCLERARVLKEYGRVDAAREAIDTGLGRLVPGSATTAHMWLLGDRAFLRASVNDLSGGRTDCDEGLRLAELVDPRDADWRIAKALLVNTLGTLHLYAGRFAQAEACHLDALHLAGTESPRARLVAHVNLGALAYDGRRFSEAAAQFEAGLKLARRLNRVKDIAACLNNLGQAKLSLGDAGEAVAVLSDARELAEQARLLDVLADGSRALAEALLASGALEEAKAQATLAVEHSRRLGVPSYEALAHATAMDCCLATAGGQVGLAEARGHLDAALVILAASGGSSREQQMAALRERFVRAGGHVP